MVSKRQILARKRFKEANPELFPKPEPTPPKDPNKKKKKTDKFKRKKSDGKETGKPNKGNFRKHPLRVPGMKPGESCFICKGQDHIAKHCPEKEQWEKHKICLLCRRRGHSLKNCPNKDDETMDKRLCYNCGETGHSLDKCPQPLQEGGTKFASCFICNERGHLSKNCPENTHGIYPKGGSCKICIGVTHLAKDCPHKGNRGSNAASGGGITSDEGMQRGKVTKFISGDDLDDDFLMGEADGSKTKPSESKGDPASDFKTNNVKAKKKQGPKVVNFVGCCIYLLDAVFNFRDHAVLWEINTISSFANAASGMAVEDECKLKFLELKTKRNHRFIIFKIEGQEVVVEKLGGPDENYDDFTASLPADECRYAVFDFDFITDENCQKSKIFFIAWSPDTSKVRMKMVYASSKDRFKRELDGIQVELQATDPSEMSMDIIKARAF
ncbi:uncharacterized protein LOC131299880 [Rhododendron vialii]|uniref:uncharacterized protein LOC131299880 n=1 Tax=Rhododendron vialii TaxID=182163 RepID=UPI00265E3C23|nr:uncharacterized protein LOC131299880 [Rhododendron vialii]